MEHTHSDTHSEHAPAIHTEYDAPPMVRLYVWLFVITLVTVATIVGAVQYFNKGAVEEQQRKEGDRANAAVSEVRQREAEALLKGGKADDIKPGATREPIERTIARIAADPALLEPVIAAPAPVPAPSSVPATPGAAVPKAPAPAPQAPAPAGGGGAK